MSKLRIASFGIRGLVGESLTPRSVIDFASAFATYAEGGRVLVGRDTRYSSPMFHSAVLSGLVSAGCEVLDFGVCPTPMLQYAVKPYQAVGAVSITGGHTAMGWNAVTLIGADGAFLEPVSGETVLEHFHARDFLKRDARHMGEAYPVTDFAAPYFHALAARVNTDAIRRAGLTVLIDPVGGAGCAYLSPFAERFGLKVVPVNAQPSGYLAREPEPRPRSALQMASIIRYTGGQAGFVLSSDMGRLSLVTETGEPASEEYTFAIIAHHILSKRSGTLVTNCCTTRTVDRIAERHHAPVIKTRVGQAFVVAALSDERGLIGGEGSGSAAWPAFSNAFDGFLMMALVLEAMTESGRPLSEILNSLPRYHMVKKAVPCRSSQAYRALEDFKHQVSGIKDARIDVTDGLRLDWPDGWVHVRTSLTQQMVRVISEAESRDSAQRRAEEAVRIIQQTL